jgi:hypothetical protein
MPRFRRELRAGALPRSPRSRTSHHLALHRPLQSNKAREVAERFDWVHAVDRAKIARRLSRARPAARGRSTCCLQVNISQSDQGRGAAEEAPALAREIAALRASRCAASWAWRARRPMSARSDRIRALRAASTMSRRGPRGRHASMGMSQDFEAAIAEGATMVRIGTAIFGNGNRRGRRMKVAFIGGGNMASAIIGGLVARDFPRADLLVVEVDSNARTRLTAAYGVKAIEAPATALGEADVMVLAVKPQQMREVAKSIAPHAASA